MLALGLNSGSSFDGIDAVRMRLAQFGVEVDRARNIASKRALFQCEMLLSPNERGMHGGSRLDAPV